MHKNLTKHQRINIKRGECKKRDGINEYTRTARNNFKCKNNNRN